MADRVGGLMAGRTVLVTGGTGGIGKATAIGLAARGARVGIVGRDRHRADTAGRDLIAFGAHGEIRAGCPFSPAPTPVQVRWDGGPASYAMCAIDALGMSAMLGRPVTITAAEPGSGPHHLCRSRPRPGRWRPRTAVVFAGAAGDACRASAGRCCGYLSFFTSARGRTRPGGPPP